MGQRIFELLEAEKKHAQAEKLSMVKENIQTLHGFVMVLAVGNVIRQFSIPHMEFYAKYKDLNVPIFQEGILTSSFVALVLILRFFLGDRTYIKTYNVNNIFVFGLDVINIIVSSVIVAYMSNFIDFPRVVYGIIFWLLLSEISWWLLRIVLGRFFRKLDGKGHNLTEQKWLEVALSQTISIFTIIGLYLYYYFTSFSFVEFTDHVRNLDINILINPIHVASIFSPDNVNALGYIFLANTLFDIVLRGPSYVGAGEFVLKFSFNLGIRRGDE